MQLTSKQWFENVLSLLDDNQLELSLAKCHLGIWFNRLEQDKLFNHHWLKALRKAHDAMFNKARDLIDIKSATDLDIKPNTTGEFKTTYQHLDTLLQSDEAMV